MQEGSEAAPEEHSSSGFLAAGLLVEQALGKKKQVMIGRTGSRSEFPYVMR